MATGKRPQLGALFGGDGPPGDQPPGPARLRAVTDGSDPTVEAAPSDDRRPRVSGAPRVLPDAGPPAAGAGRGGTTVTPWSMGGWMDPIVLAAQYFDFWQTVLDTSRRLVLGATAVAMGRPRPNGD